jgi:C4-type Zn-finger protein
MIARYMEAGISEEKANAIMDKVTETNKKAITYKVKDIKTKGNKATVTVTFSVKKPKDLWDEIVNSEPINYR